jgi:hypothetical protein
LASLPITLSGALFCLFYITYFPCFVLQLFLFSLFTFPCHYPHSTCGFRNRMS